MLNKVILIGRLAHTPEVKESATGGMKIARMRLAVQRDVKGNDGVDADFFDLTAFGKTAEFVEKYFEKGMQIAADGRLQNHEYTSKDGERRHAVRVICDRVYFADSKKADDPPPFEFSKVPPRPLKPETIAYGKQLEQRLSEPLPKPVEVSDDEFPF